MVLLLQLVLFFLGILRTACDKDNFDIDGYYRSTCGKGMSPSCLQSCIYDSMETEGNHPLDVFQKKKGHAYEVVGLTEECIFFTFFLGQNTTELSRNDHIFWADKQGNKNFGKKYCAGKKIMLMRTTGENRKMMFMVDAVGRRIRVQSVYDGNSIKVDHVLYIQVDATNRRLHAYSQPINKGYTIENIFNANYHVYVLGRNHYGLRIFELMVEVDAQLNVIPYLREESVDINQMLQPPFERPQVTVFQNLDLNNDNYKLLVNAKINMLCGLSKALINIEDIDLLYPRRISIMKRELKDNGVRMEDWPELVEFMNDTAHRFTRWKKQNEDKIEFYITDMCAEMGDEHRVEAWGITLWSHHAVVPSLAMPFISILGQTHRGVSRSAARYEKYLHYQEKKGRFHIVRTKCITHLNYIMIYFYQMASNLDGEYKYPPNRYVFSTKRSFNEMNYHRRMSKPHSIYRLNRRNLRYGSIRLICIFFGAMIAVGSVFLAFRCCNWGWRKHLKKKEQRASTNTS